MAEILGKSRLNLRFSINQRGVKKATSTEFAGRMHKGVRSIVPRLMVRYADGQYSKIESQVRARIKRDVEAEVRHTARQYRRMVIGAGHTRVGPASTALTTRSGATAGGPMGFTAKSGMPSWPPRNPEYIEKKIRKGLTPNWFIAETRMLATTMGKGEVWQEIFGPVRVTTIRKKYTSGGSEQSILPQSYNKDFQVGLMQIKVEAFGRLTPTMIRSYSSHSGLLSLVAQYDEQIAYRLGGPYPAKYRPTLQPFLEFVLAGSIPYAISQRLKMGLSGSILAESAG